MKQKSDASQLAPEGQWFLWAYMAGWMLELQIFHGFSPSEFVEHEKENLKLFFFFLIFSHF